MKKLTLSLLTVFLLAFNVSAWAQATAATRTATTAALTNASGTAVVAVVSVTGMTASTTAAPTYLAICDGSSLVGAPACEMMLTVSISGTNVTVRRGQLSTLPIAHLSGSIVWYGSRGNLVSATGGYNTTAAFVSPTPNGQCTRSLNAILPVINPLNGDISDCILSLATTTDQWAVVNAGIRATFWPHKRMNPTVSTYTALLTDAIIGVNTRVAVTITLPACTGCEGKWYLIQDEYGQNSDAPTTITVAGSAAQLVNSGASAALVPSAIPYQGAWVFFDGSSNSWYIPRTRNSIP